MGSGEVPVSGAVKDLIDLGIDVKQPSLLERISRLSPWRFVLAMSIFKILSHFFLHLLMLLFLFARYHPPAKPGHFAALEDRSDLAVLFAYAVLVGPWIETVVGQGLPMAYTFSRSKPT
jgi:hypothetical protein